MTASRRGRRRYYDGFSRFYDAFVRMHSRRDEDDTRKFLADAAGLEGREAPRVLDVCCGTGSVILEFGRRFPGCRAVGLDFSRGMLENAREKNGSGPVRFVQADATALPFPDDAFDAVTCSHALYELKGESRREALREMKRVVRPGGCVLLMEHEVPRHPVVKLLFHVRLLSMGSEDAREFVKAGAEPFRKIFSEVSLTHSPSGKSKLYSCRK